MNKWILALCLSISLLICNNLFAQIQELPHGYLQYFQTTNANTRTTADSSTLTIPFWDDFSTSKIFPDTAKWVNSENVTITSGTAIDPPTINVATFDGVDGYGQPHSGNGKAIGEGDSLVSRFIDLTEVDNPGTLYLSFYVQREGKGELPDDEDEIRLLFKDQDNNWVTVWDTTGTELDNSNEFIFKIFAVTDEAYHHEYFQFKFESAGRLSGAFDTWNIDYVYLNDGRDADDQAITDRAFATFPTSILKEYSALPYDHFATNPQQYLDSSNVVVKNLNNILTSLEYNASIRLQGVNDVLDSIRKTKTTVINPFSSNIVGTDIVSGDIFDELGDSLYLEVEFVLNSDDTLIDNTVNPRVNDTLRVPVVIHQELAYDDGTAESSVALNSNGAKIAYEYYTPIEDKITSLRIYLPKFSSSQPGSSMVLYVWDKLEEDEQLHRQEAVPIKASAINEFGTYELLKPVSVEDTFYIGLEQTIDDFFPVGLDKNTNTGNKIYFNVDGSWEPAMGLEGNLMMRPVFGDAEGVITSTEFPEDDQIIVYPNPFSSIFNIKGMVDRVQIYNLQGKMVFEEKFGSSAIQIDGSGIPHGVYILRVFSGSQTFERKVIKK